MNIRRCSAGLLLAFACPAGAADYYINTTQGRIEQLNGLTVPLAGVSVPLMGLDTEGVGIFTVPGSVTFSPGDRVFFRGARAAQIIVQGNLTIPEGVLIDASGGTDSLNTGSQRNGGGGVGAIEGFSGGDSAGGAGQTGGAGGAGGQGGLLSQGTLTPNPGLAGGAGSGGQTGETGESGTAQIGEDGFRHPASAGSRATGGEGGAGGAGGFSFGFAAPGGTEGAPVSSGSNGVNGLFGFDGGDGANGQDGGGGRGGRYPTRDGTLRGGGGGSSGRAGGSGGGGGSGASGGGGGGGGSSGLYLFSGFFPKVDEGGAGGAGGNSGAGGEGGVGTRGGVGGAGAGAFELRATGLITLGGTLRANGEAGGPPSGLPEAGTAGLAGTAGTAGTARPDPTPKGGNGGNGAAGGRGGKGGNGGLGAPGGGGSGGTIILRSDLGLVKLPTATIETNGGAAGGPGAEAGQSGAYYESAPTGLLGLEQFDYPDGAIASRHGGAFWNWKNQTPAGRTAGVSDWDPAVGTPAIASGRLVTQNSSATREYNGPVEGLPITTDEGLGAISAFNNGNLSFRHKIVYCRVTLTTGASLTSAASFGISSLDFGTERVVFGKKSGSPTFGIEEPGVSTTNSTTTITANTTYTLVTKLDFGNGSTGTASLFVNPDLNAVEPAPLVSRAFNATLWSSALRLGSGSGSPITWDDLVVAASWDELGTVVTTATDEDNGSLNPAAGTGVSLREAVKFSPSGTLITFAPALSRATLRLNSDISISGACTIDATALPGGFTLSGNNATRHFHLNTGKSLTLRGLTLTGGNGNGAGANANGFGGAISNEGGALTLTHCTLSGNSASALGGAIFIGSGTATLTQCTLSGNSASSLGGAIDNGDTLTLTQCTLFGNSASNFGGAISNTGTLTLHNSIVAGNSAINGADIINYGTVTRAGANIVQSHVNDGPGTDSGPAAITSDPKLTPLGHFGGPVMTMHPLIGSPAIDAAGSTDPGGTDARGFPRFVDGNNSAGAQLDIGAVEAGPLRTVDSVAALSLTGLRATINASTAPGARIAFSSSVFPSATISDGLGQLDIPATANGLFIDASNLSSPVTISGNNQSRVFNIPATATVAMHSLRIVNGNVGSGNSGGGILNAGTSTVMASSLSGNSAAVYGGGISNDSGTCVLVSSTLSGNSANFGGGIHNDSGTCVFVSSTLSGNSANLGGGGIYNAGNCTAIASTLSGNSAAIGGGGIYTDGPTTPFHLTSGIVAGNTAPTGPDIDGSLTPGGPNNLIGGDSLLAPLGDYGGPTQTMPPRPGSPAIDAGTATTALTDQRGFSRTRDGDGNGTVTPDIGAVEASLVAVTTVNDNVTGSLRAALTEAAAQPGPDTVYFTPAVAAAVTLASEILITDPAGVTIDASDRPTGLVIDGGPGANRHFRIDPAGVVTLQRLRLTGGNGDGGGSPAGYGGSVFNSGSLTVRECTLQGNTSGVAGAIYNQAGALTVERSTFHSNTAGGVGAILHESLTPMRITDSTFTNNNGEFEGGALTVSNFRPATITHCTISGNRVTNAGGGGGGGIRTIAGDGNLLTLRYSIVTGNTDANSPGVANAAPGPDSTANLLSGNARLAPLGDYGGPTQTMALRPGSPALNAVPASPATTDQRGFGLVGVKDLGAYEAGNTLLTHYNAWIWESLPNTATGTQAATTSDYDNDGQTNEEEWFSFTHPGNPTSRFTYTSVTDNGSNIEISISPAITGRSYELQSTTDLTHWTTVTTVTLSNALGLTLQGSLIENPRQFYRVRARLP